MTVYGNKVVYKETEEKEEEREGGKLKKRCT
jgi:hypothetical protein